MVRGALTAGDIERLLRRETSTDAKSDLVAKVLELLDDAQLSATEVALSKDILRKLANDVEVVVRQAVSRQIVTSPYLDDDLAAVLARDVEFVALPILDGAPRLAETLLVEILQEPSTRKAVAIAGRPDVTPVVVDAILATANLSAVIRVVKNESAQFTEANYAKLLDDFGQLPPVQEPLGERASLPASIVERLVVIVSDSLRDVIIARHGLDRKTVEKIVAEGRELATVQLLRRIDRHGLQSSALAKQLRSRGQLSASLIFLALASGDLDFYFAALGELAGIPPSNAAQLAFDRGGRGLAQLLDHAAISSRLRPMFLVAMKVVIRCGGVIRDLGRYQADVISSVFKQCSQIGDSEIDNLLCMVLNTRREPASDPWELLQTVA